MHGNNLASRISHFLVYNSFLAFDHSYNSSGLTHLLEIIMPSASNSCLHSKEFASSRKDFCISLISKGLF